MESTSGLQPVTSSPPDRGLKPGSALATRLHAFGTALFTAQLGAEKDRGVTAPAYSTSLPKAQLGAKRGEARKI